YASNSSALRRRSDSARIASTVSGRGGINARIFDEATRSRNSSSSNSGPRMEVTLARREAGCKRDGRARSENVDGNEHRDPDGAHEVPVESPEANGEETGGGVAACERVLAEPDERHDADEHVQGVERREGVEDRRVRSAFRRETLAEEIAPRR